MPSQRRSLGYQSTRSAVLDRVFPDLLIRSISRGTRGSGHDLKRFLYRGAAGQNGRGDLDNRIAKGELGPALTERLETLESIHASIEGAPNSPNSKRSTYAKVSLFVQWVDRQSDATRLTKTTAKALFLDYADHLRKRVQVDKNLKLTSAIIMVNVLSKVLAPVFDPDATAAHRALRDLTSIPRPKRLKRSRGIQGDKQRLDHTFQFGHFLADVCAGLTMEAVRGSLPFEIAVAEGEKTLRLPSSGFNFDLKPNQIRDKSRRNLALRARAALPSHIDAKGVRSALINLRISAEMLIFISQTSMNLAQTKDLPRAEYRWQTDDEDYIVRAVYKARRQGVAKFIVFRAYRDHLNRYLAWLDALGLNGGDDRLFPSLHPVDVPPAYALPGFDSLRRHCKSLSIPFVGPRDLRKTRINWLLRRSRDPDMTAEMAAHTKEVLLRVYEEGDLHSASQEIGAYHAKTDPTLPKPRTAPVCLKGDDAPRPLSEIPKGAPQPDCVTPEGCLWCEHFRDVLAPDYCWRLASHRHLKSLEITLFNPPASQPIHPGYLVIDRLSLKLKAVAMRSAVCADWVKDANERVREGNYHPRWAGLIETIGDLV